MEAVISTDIKELNKLFQGKVRDVYEVDKDKLLLVATDRISAFDVIFNEGIPEKGQILTRISNEWFNFIDWIPNHILSIQPEVELPFLSQYPELKDRCVLVQRLKRLDVECVARGYMFGSAWKEYQESGSVCGIEFPPGLRQAEKILRPIFTPAIKASSGHDENISFEESVKIIGDEKTALFIKEATLEIYSRAHNILWSRGIILADTKLEFGLSEDGEVILIDEVITPDSSRFWARNTYKVGISPPNYDKQFIRDYLETLEWDKTPPPPPLPTDIIKKTLERYREIEEIIHSI